MFNSVFFLITGCFVMLLLSFTRSLSATGSRTYFLLENEEIFEKCDGHPGNGIHDLFDMSTVNIEVLEYGMHVDGYVKLIWDVEPTDRISVIELGHFSFF